MPWLVGLTPEVVAASLAMDAGEDPSAILYDLDLFGGTSLRDLGVARGTTRASQG